jgi:alcohol dehydrogenase
MFEFNLRTNLKIGVGEALNLGKYLTAMKFTKPAVIIDGGVLQTNYVQEIIESLKILNFENLKIWQYNLKAEPDYDSLEKARLEFSADCLIAIGGGSVIDFAKGIAILAVNLGPARSYRGFPENIQKPLPVIALPTTAGTGSEVTFNAAFIDWKENKKLGINSLENFPVLAILDAKLVSGCPRKVALASGIDTLVHVVEGFASLKSGELTKSFARESFRLMFENLESTLQNPENLELWEKLQLGAYFGGLTLLGSGGGPTGALSYTLGVNFKVPHGLAGAVFLPYIVEYNLKNGYDYPGLYKSELSLSEELFALYKRVGAPMDLKSFGVNAENIQTIIMDIEGYEKAFAQNPIPFSVQEGKKLVLRLI